MYQKYLSGIYLFYDSYFYKYYFYDNFVISVLYIYIFNFVDEEIEDQKGKIIYFIFYSQ